MFSTSSVSKAILYNSSRGLPRETTDSYTHTPRSTLNPKTMITSQITNHVKEMSMHNGVVSKPDNVSQTIHNILASNCTRICCANYNFYCHNNTKENGQNLSRIIHDMEVNKRTTSRHLRRLSSARDQRTSSKTMGIVAMLIIGTIFACIVVMDIPIVVTYLKNVNHATTSV